MKKKGKFLNAWRATLRSLIEIPKLDLSSLTASFTSCTNFIIIEQVLSHIQLFAIIRSTFFLKSVICLFWTIAFFIISWSSDQEEGKSWFWQNSCFASAILLWRSLLCFSNNIKRHEQSSSAGFALKKLFCSHLISSCLMIVFVLKTGVCLNKEAKINDKLCCSRFNFEETIASTPFQKVLWFFIGTLKTSPLKCQHVFADSKWLLPSCEAIDEHAV